jgi:hypothetical protein
MRVPFGKKGLVAAGAAITGAVFFWRVRARRREEAEAREWEAEIAGAVDEGRAATTAGPAAAPSSDPSTA